MAETKEEIKELMKALIDEYPPLMKKFGDFRYSGKIDKTYRPTLDHFIHEANRSFSNLRYNYDKDNIPKRGVYSTIWLSLNTVEYSIGMMRFILSLAGA